MVSGVVIIAVGIELGKIGLGVLFEAAVEHNLHTGRMFVIAFCVLVTMTGLCVWAGGLPRLLCAFAGILVGYAMSALLGVFPKDFAFAAVGKPVFRPAMAVVASIVLNAIFLAGTWRYSQLRLGGDGSPLSAGSVRRVLCASRPGSGEFRAENVEAGAVRMSGRSD